MHATASHICRLAARAIVMALVAAVCSCSAVKHVLDGKMLLDNVDITIDNDSIDVRDLRYFLRQTPNHKVLGFLKLQLATYNLSGRDSTGINKWIRSLGKPPVIYDENLTDKSRLQLQQALINRGYMDAVVTVDTNAHHDKKRIDVTYNIAAGRPYTIGELHYNIPDPAIAHLVYTDTAAFGISRGSLLDRTRLDQLRARIANRLRNNGYYAFNKDYITFTADTVAGSREVDLTLNLREAPVAGHGGAAVAAYTPYVVRNVYFITDYDPQQREADSTPRDTLHYRDIYVVYGKDRYLRPSALYEKCDIIPGRMYSATDVEHTYEALARLGIVRYLNIEMQRVAPGTLDAYIMMTRNRKQGITVELEGTNSEGDLGAGAGITYTHRNLAKGSETLTVKLRGAYESLSGNLDGLINNRYTELAGEVGLTFPKFKFPLLSTAFKRRIRATSEFTLTSNYQERPEYTRIIMGAAWKYKWNLSRGAVANRHTVDLIDVNYVRLPKSTLHFLDSIAPANPLLRYSYEDHFIMRLGYSFYRTNRRLPSPSSTVSMATQPSITTIRASVETAGNLLYALSSLTGQKKTDGAYRIFGIQYAQYVKGEADYSYTLNFNDRNALAFHIGGGLAVPYLNSSMVPFEKRFYAGGANSVRGWSVRSLGPGRYDSTNSVTDFINQCGDILLNLNLEYRAKLFWVFEGAAFIDAGNVWTIRDYRNQAGGLFRFSTFYKELAAAYGVGLRMDFTYFLLRFDLGIKAHNPAYGQERWPLLHPRWHRDTTFHLAVGYPF